jgi:choice-of-anchor A domain-containing protein/RHS repeat-associated protein
MDPIITSMDVYMSFLKSAFFAVVISSVCSYASAQASSLGAAQQFNAFIRSNFTAAATDVQGRLAVGGDVSVTSYGTATGISTAPNEYVLLAGGSVTYTNGRIFTGSLLAEGDVHAITSEVRNGMEPGSSIEGHSQLPLNIATEFDVLEALATQLKDLTPNGSVLYQWGGTYLTGDCTSSFQVFSLDGAILKTSNSLVLECVPEDATILFNISGNAPGFHNIGLTHLNPRASRILYNFYQATGIDFVNVGVEGTVLAPFADIVNPRGYLNGTIIAKSWNGPMALRHVPFSGLLPGATNNLKFTSTPISSVAEGDLYQYQVEIADLTFGTASVELVTGPPGMQLTANNLLAWQTGFDAAGNYEIVLGLTDGYTVIQQAFTLTVTGVNQTPIVTEISEQFVKENEQLSLQIVASDPDGEPLSFTLNTTDYSGLTLGNDGSLIWSPGYLDEGRHEISVTVSDGVNSVDLIIVVNVSNQNRAPIFAPLPATGIEGEKYQTTVTVSDPDGDEIQIELLQAPAGFSFDAISGSLDWTPDYADAGTHVIRLVATDGELETVYEYLLVIENRNQPPTFESLPVVTTTENELYQYVVDLADADLDGVTLKIIEGPAGMEIVDSNIVSWQTNYELSGEYPVILEASDQNDQTQQLFTLTVVNVNRPPLITPVAEQSISEGSIFTWQFEAIDPDGDPITFAFSGDPNPEWNLTSAGLFSWQTDFGDANEYSISVKASDGELEESITLPLNVQDENRAPILAPIANVTTTAGITTSVGLSLSDPDGDALDVTATSTSEGISINYQQGVLFVTGQASDVGTHTVNVTALDNKGGLATRQFILTILPSNQVLELTTNEDQPLQLNLGDFIINATAYTLRSLPQHGQVIGVPPHVTYLPAKDYNGQDSLSYKYQVNGSTAEMRFNIRITPINDAPYFITSPSDIDLALGETFEMQVLAADVDSDSLIYAVDSSFAGVEMDVDGWFTIQTSTASEGEHLVSISVDDGVGGVAHKSFRLGLHLEDQENPFRITSNPPLITSLGTNYLYPVETNESTAQGIRLLSGPRDAEMQGGTIVWQSKEMNTLNKAQRLNSCINYEGYTIGNAGSDVLTIESYYDPVRFPKIIGTVPSSISDTSIVDNQITIGAIARDLAAKTWFPNTQTFTYTTTEPGWTGVLTRLVIVGDAGAALGYAAGSYSYSFPIRAGANERALAFHNDTVATRLSHRVCERSDNFGQISGNRSDTWETCQIADWGHYGVSTGVGEPGRWKSDLAVVNASVISEKNVLFSITNRGLAESGVYVIRIFQKVNGEFSLLHTSEQPSLASGAKIDLNFEYGEDLTGDIRIVIGEGIASESCNLNNNVVDLMRFEVEATSSRGIRKSQRFWVPTLDDRLTILSDYPKKVYQKSVYGYQMDVSGGVEPYSFSVTSAEGVSATVDSKGVFTWSPTTADLGQYSFDLTVTDQAGNSRTRTLSIEVLETQDNTAPVVTSRPIKSAVVGQEYVYAIAAEDAEDDTFIIRNANDASGNNILSDGILRWTPTRAEYNYIREKNALALQGADASLGGAFTNFEVEVVDEHGLIGFHSWIVHLTLPDSELVPNPTITSAPVNRSAAGERYEYQVEVTDDTNSQLTYSLVKYPPGMVVSDSGLVSWEPSPSQAGSHLVTIAVTNGDGGRAEQSYYLVLAPSSVAPVLSSSPAQSVEVGSTYQYQMEFVGEISEDFSFDVLFGPEGMTISDSGMVEFTPDQNDTGIHSVLLQAVYGGQYYFTQSFNLTVVNPGEAFITSKPGLTAVVGQSYSYSISVSNGAGAQLSFDGPAGMTLSEGQTLQWTPNPADIGRHSIQIYIDASSQRQIAQVFDLTVVPNDSDLVTWSIASTPSYTAKVNQTYSYSLAVNKPANTEVTYEVFGPAGMSISTSGKISWVPTAGQTGAHYVVVRVSHASGVQVEQRFTVTVSQGDQPNRGPEFTGNPLSTGVAGLEYRYTPNVMDPDGDALNLTLLASPPGMSIDGNDTVVWVPETTQVGSHPVSLRIDDGRSYIVLDYTITVSAELEPVEIQLTATPQVVELGGTTSITVNSYGGFGELKNELFVDGEPVVLVDGKATFMASRVGRYDLRVVTTDNLGSYSQTGFFSVSDAADNEAPVVILHSPASGASVTEPQDVRITATDANLVDVKLYLLGSNNTQPQIVFASDSSIQDQAVAKFDPTMRVNGQYQLLLQATDTNGKTSVTGSTFLVEGDLKVGNFSMTINDLRIPLAGIPIEVNRTYDSRRRSESLDFGYGWSIDYQNIRLDESSEPAAGWQQIEQTSLFKIENETVSFRGYCILPLSNKKVTVTLPNGDVEKFRVEAVTVGGGTESVNNRSCYLVPSRYVNLRFVPEDQTYSKLEALDAGSLYLTDLTNGNLSEDIVETAAADVSKYRLTTRAGYQYVIDQYKGIETVTDPNGNVITYTDDGIFHSAGQSVEFERGANGRITGVIAPNGTRLTYHYDAKGDLEFVENRDQTTTRYTYNSDHGLVDIIDPSNRKLVKNLFDETGRLYGQEDGNGVVKTFNHDLDTKTSLVTDRDGRSTLFEYDAEGLIAAETVLISDGSYSQDIVTTYGYDANGNQETRTIGDSVWINDFDERDNQLFAKDPEGRTVYYREHNERGQEGEIEDEMGRISTLDYDAAGNLNFVEMPAVLDPDTGATVTPRASNTINASGQITNTVDLAGLESVYTYYPAGHQWAGQKKTDWNSIAGTTTYTYDANFNVKTATRGRTVNGAVILETVTYEYDARDRLTKTTYPDGTYTETVYDLAGNTDKERDRVGVWTDYEYDAYGRLVQTDYADGTSEIRTYTAEGLLETITDRSGYVTRNEYDEAGRLWKVHNEQDGTFTETRYTLQGWVQYEWDEKRNRTEHRYDKAGRRTHTIRVDDAGNELVWGFEYYPNGELQKETDPLNHTTEYVINELDQRIATLYHNGTSLEERYDLMGRRTATIDQNLRRTDFVYDDLGRMTGVTPDVMIEGEPVPETSHTYDEVGNKLTQTDANGHTTRWTYDYYGRVLSRALPEGMSEYFEYVDAERKVIYTDFNGDTITTIQDEMGRVQRVEYSKDGAVESFTYWPNDQVKTATTAEGTTEYFYDQRNRLDYELRPDGTRMDYDYDLVGNRTLVKVTRAGTVTSQMSYTYDALNRLKTATYDLTAGETTDYTYDAAGNLDTVTYPNGLITDYDYNSINQLTDVFTRDGNGTLISHYAYKLDNTGRRTVVAELKGRTTAYCHDELYRLKAETVFDNATALTEGCLTPAQRTGASYTADYEYDWTGNRTYETVDGVQTAYSYDMNDRLQQTGGTVYGYDDNGNTISETLNGVTSTYVYNGKNQIIQTSKAGITSTYTYNPNGIRNGKTEGGITTRFIVDENRDYAQVLEEITNGIITTTYSYGHDLISQDKNGVTSFYHYDGLGSTRALSDVVGTLTDTYDYEAFGEVLTQTGSTENSYLFTGEQFDAGLNQYYLRARYYDQSVGRFTSMDTWMGNNNDPITLHKYAYGNADPSTFVDPSGNNSILEMMQTTNTLARMSALSVARVGLPGVTAANDALWSTAVVSSSGLGSLGTAGLGLISSLALTASSKNEDKLVGTPMIVFGLEFPGHAGHIYDAQMGTGSNSMPTPFALNYSTGHGRGWLQSTLECDKEARAKVSGPRACDEYPFDKSTQGGEANYARLGVSLRLLDTGESSRTGGFLSSFYSAARLSPDGVSPQSRFIVLGIPGAKSFYTDRSGTVHFWNR